jgi:long-chain-fatty-acid--CoA ligase ACSBG
MSDDSLPLSTTDIKQGVQIRIGSEGFGALEPKTVMQVFDDVVAKHGERPALYQKVGSDQDYTIWTWAEYRAKVDAFAKALMSLGFQPFDIINIIGFNSREWFVADVGAIAAGGVAAGIYTTNLPDACKYISTHSEAKVVVVEGLKQLEKYIAIAKDLPALKAIVLWGPEQLPANIKHSVSVPVYTFDDFLSIGVTITDAELKARKDALKANHTCTLIYTSGTTGPPKAVMITHDNITWVVRAMITRTPSGTIVEDDSMISYLPLSHVAAQLLDIHMPLLTGSQTYFANADALKGSLGATLKEVRPTLFFGVPRVFEKIYEKMMEVGKSMTGVPKMLSTWAKGTMISDWESKEYGSNQDFDLFFPLTFMQVTIAKQLLHKAHVALGLDRCKAIFVSAAPIEVKILKYFASLDLPIMELFGQSECTGPHAVNSLQAFKFGTVGRPLPGTETRIDPETGELCCTLTGVAGAGVAGG